MLAHCFGMMLTVLAFQTELTEKNTGAAS